MKTAISLPDALFEEAEGLAKRLGKSRSQLYSEALSEYLARHEPSQVTDRLNRVLEEIGDEDRRPDRAVTRAGVETLGRVEW